MLRSAAEAPEEEREALARKACKLHKAWLGYTWASYSPQAHKGLAATYEADGRFAAYYNAFAPGGAAFLCGAIRQFAK